MNHLFRELAPISDRAWDEVCQEARDVLRQFLAGRKVLSLSGPKGWDHQAEPLGRVTRLDSSPHEGVESHLRIVQPLVELRAPFELPRSELNNLNRGAEDANLEAVAEAARRIALAEDTAIFAGYPAAAIRGIGETSPHDPIEIGDDYEEYPSLVARAVARLRVDGVDGPYAIALGPRCYQGVVETTQRGGYPVFEHLRKILEGPIVWAPAVDGAVVVSQRGGDFELVLGQDISLGYQSHSDEIVSLYLQESMTFRTMAPEAGIELRHHDE